MLDTRTRNATKIKIKREDTNKITFLFDSLNNKLYKLIVNSGTHTWVSPNEIMLKEYRPDIKVWWQTYLWDDEILYKLNDFDIIKRANIQEFVDKLQVLLELES